MVVRIMSGEDIGDLLWGMWGRTEREEGRAVCLRQNSRNWGSLGS